MTAASVRVAGRYRLGEIVGTGGMGRVWLARDEVLDRDVAVKEIDLPPDLPAGDPDTARQRILREARAAARLNHPNVVQVYDILEADGHTWIVMEYVPSRSLQDVMRADGPLDPRRAARIGLEVLAALNAAHRAGVRHRDVKPANVLLGDDGRAVLTDFGIAAIEGDGIVTSAEMVVGSPQYMAPERVQRGETLPASDLWSLGATLYAAVEGRSPYERATAMQTLTAVAAEEPDPMQRAGVLEPVLEGLLRKDPAVRIDAAEAERRLRAALAGERIPRQRRDRVPKVARGTKPVPVVKPAPDDGQALPVAEPDLAPAPSAPAPSAPAASAPVAAPSSAPAEPASPTSTSTSAGSSTSSGASVPAGTSASTADAPPASLPEPAPARERATTGETAAEPDAVVVSSPVPVRPADPRPATRRRWPLVAAILAVVILAGALVSWFTLRPRTSPQAGPRPTATTTAGQPAGEPPAPGTAASGAPGSGPGGAASGAPGTVASGAPANGVPASGAPVGGAPASGAPGTQAGGAPGTAPSPAVPAFAGGPLPTLPAGWRDYRDASGFSVYVPEGWTRSQKGSIVYFRDGRNGRVLGIDRSDEPRWNPVADWKGQRDVRRERGDFPGYHEVHIREVDYGLKAADWEFTFNGSRTRQHVNNRGVVMSRTQAYGIWWQTSDAAWESKLPELRLVFASFRPVKE